MFSRAGLQKVSGRFNSRRMPIQLKRRIPFILYVCYVNLVKSYRCCYSHINESVLFEGVHGPDECLVHCMQAFLPLGDARPSLASFHSLSFPFLDASPESLVSPTHPHVTKTTHKFCCECKLHHVILATSPPPHRYNSLPPHPQARNQ